MHASVLVLNANFEPIHICSTRRAVNLMLAEKASLIANGRGYIHTARLKIPAPSVIRLAHMVHRPRPHHRLTRREVLRRDNFICQYCGRHAEELTIDHVIPRRLGGRFTWDNVVTACAPCNHKKGGKTLEEAGMRLLRQPKEPPSSALYRFGRSGAEFIEWEPFLQGW